MSNGTLYSGVHATEHQKGTRAGTVFSRHPLIDVVHTTDDLICQIFHGNIDGRV